MVLDIDMVDGWRALSGALEVARVVAALAPAGIRVAPLKGVALQALLPLEVVGRRLGDVDLLVLPRHHASAVTTLAAAGYRLRARSRDGGSATFARRTGGLSVDLHAKLFPRGLFGLDAEGVFARSSVDDESYGVRVSMPHPHDLLAHGIGHFAKGRHGAADVERVTELIALAEHLALDPAECAEHLARHGLARAARYTLDFEGERAFARALLGQLPDDPLAPGLVALVRRLNGTSGNQRTFTALAPHLLNANIRAGVRSATLHVGHGLAQRLRGRGREPDRAGVDGAGVDEDRRR